MNRNRKITAITSKVVAAGAAAGLALSMVVPAFAAGRVYTPVSGTTTQVAKYLVLDDEAYVPNYSFTYAIAGGEAQLGQPGELPIFSGSDATKVIGVPTIGTADFTSSQSKVKADALEGYLGKAYEDESVAKSMIDVDFTGVTFNEPGIYRYVITEDAATYEGIVECNDATRILDVYIVDDGDGQLSVGGYVLYYSYEDELHKTDGYDNVPVDPDVPANPDEPANGDNCVYGTANINLSKEVEGNQASRDEYFEIKCSITNALPGTIYDVDLSGAEGTTQITGMNAESHTNPTRIECDDAGAAEVTFWLQDGQSVLINGIAYSTEYEIEESEATLTAEGYTASVENEDADATGEAGHTAGVVDADDDAERGSADDGTFDVAFTNEKDGIIPTAVYMAVGSSAIAVIAAGAGIAGIKLSRKRNNK